MQKPKKGALKFVTILTYIVFVLYIAAFIVLPILNKFDDASSFNFLAGGLVSFGQGHTGNIPAVFTFGLSSGIIWSIAAYVAVALIVIFIVLAIKIGGKHGRLICANGMCAIYLMIIPVVLTGAGFDFYMAVINKVDVYANAEMMLLISCFVLLGLAALYCILAIVLFFVCGHDAKKYPAETNPEEDLENHVVEQVANALDEEEIIDMNKDELLALIKDVVREVVSEELDKREAKKPVVQYFNGMGPYVPGEAPAVAPAAAPAPAPVIVNVAPAVAPAPAPVEEAPAEEEDENKPAAVRVPFIERIVKADKDIQEAYNEIKNEFLSYGVHSRVSTSGDTFRLHRKTYAKVVMAGKGLKIYFALDPKDYKDSPIPFQDVSEKVLYEEIPFAFKVKSDLSRRRCKQLIQETMAKDGIEQGEVEDANFVKEMKAELKAAK